MLPGRPRPTLLHRSNYHFSPPTKRETSTIRLSRLSRAYPLTLFSSPLSLPLLILLFFFFPSRPRRNFLFDAPREPPTRRWLHRLSRNSVTLQPRERSSFPRVRFCCVGNEESPFTRRFFEVFRILGGDCWKRLLRRKSVK